MSAKPCRWFPHFMAMLVVLTPAVCLAAFGQDTEKPVPEFTRKGEAVTAKLIPRAKSTSVEISFKVSGGKLGEIRAYDFELAKRPEVDIKNYKSDLFEIRIGDVPKGGEAKISVTSQFFTSGTEYRVFNPKLPSPWMNPGAESISHPDRVYELVINAKDGGNLDADGAADGQITVIGGPRDSFWGYALGTLFIRFFGIFIVLGVLMAGMLVSGKIFQAMDKPKPRAPAAAPPLPDAAPAEPMPDADTAAAIACALHLHFAALQTGEQLSLNLSGPAAWSQSGRIKIMEERFLTFNRQKR